eukprot:SAG11_NODE_68_length_18649_cov_29.058005_6_plen_193_part_00
MKMPSAIAQHPSFKAIFGSAIPNCTPLLNREAVRCIAASHNNVRYTFEDWSSKTICEHVCLKDDNEPFTWEACAGDTRFVGQPVCSSNGEEVTYCGQRFVKTALSALATAEECNPPVLEAIFAEFSKTLDEEFVYIQINHKEQSAAGKDIALLTYTGNDSPKKMEERRENLSSLRLTSLERQAIVSTNSSQV